jgi:type II secretory pathway component PulK
MKSISAAEFRMVQPTKHRRGMVLILVLIVVMILALGAYSFTDLMMTHQESTMLSGRQTQTRLLVDSGVEMLRLFLALTDDQKTEAGGLFDNPDRFKGVTVVLDEDPQQQASFTVVAPSITDDGSLGGVRYGLEDESTRLNLNTLLMAEKQQPGAATQLLMSLPGMTEDVSDAILDWLDTDEEQRPLGAEADYYSGVSPPYACKNGPLETVEELLLVRGVTPRLLFGMDVNRNGMIDSHEQLDREEQGEVVEGAERGWSAFLTLYSLENNLRPDGQPRIYLNQSDLTKLHQELTEALSPEWATFIVAYRQNGPYSGMAQAQQGSSGALDLTKQAKAPLTQLLDLVDAKTQVTFSGASEATVLQSPVTKELGSLNSQLPLLMENVTINPSPTIPGRINVNQAPRAILDGIPGITPDVVEQIVSRREYDSTDNPGRRYETWLLAEGVVTLEQMRLLMPFVTGGGDVYRAQVVGYYQSGQAASRVEAVFDATRSPVRIVFWRDISHLGRGYALETLGVNYSETPAPLSSSN